MSLRIVSGVLMPKDGHQVNDEAIIELKSNTVDAGPATISDRCNYGGNTHYDNKPCKAVSIRAFKGKPNSINLTDEFISNATPYAKVKIKWNCDGGTIQEITYFFAGEE